MKKLVAASIGLAVLGTCAYVALTNLRSGQDFLLEQAIEAQVAGMLKPYDFVGLEVMVCGSSSPLPDPTRAQACIMVRAGDQMFIIDSGSGSNTVMLANGAPYQLIRGLLLTHFHSDHISGIGDMNLASWVAGRPEPMLVIGPQGVEEVVAGYNMAFALDRSYRTLHHGEDLMPAALGVIAARTIEPGVIHNEGGLTITAFEVDHSPIKPAFGYRFDYMGRSVVVSGDTIVTKGLEQAAMNVDLLLTDALSHKLIHSLAKAAAAAGADKRAQVLRDVLDYHVDTRNLDGMAQRSNIRQVALYHLVPPTRNDLMEKIFTRDIETDVVMTHDGMRFWLPADSNEIQID